ncbi:uncharacterized protein [Argopecten irradians]|uniref:uncharacterized protein n=1 Tax=Argopecten irradians TaxID=31199 RepID=UPI003710EA5E
MASNVSLGDRHGQVHVPRRPKGDPKCSVHRTKEVVLHCSDCNELICITCSISTHNGHRQVELTDITSREKSVLQDYINTTEKTTLLHIQQEIVSVESKITENDTDFEELEQKVKDHGEACKKQIDTLTEEFVSKSVKFREENRDLLIKYKKELEERQTFLLEHMKECKQVLQQGTSIQVYDTTVNIPDNVSEFPAEPTLCTVDFRPCQSMTEQMRTVWGILDISTLLASGVKLCEKTLDQPVVRPKFQRPMECTSISPGSSGVWLSDCESKEMLLVDVEGRIKQKTKHNGDIHSITLSPNSGNIWFCCVDDLSIYEVLSNGKELVKRITTNSLPERICISKEENVIVGSGINITIYTTNGKVTATSSVSKELQKKGTVTPGSVSQCPVTSHIAVTYMYQSKEDTSCGVLHVLNKDLILQFVYEGTECDLPRNTVYDSRGNLVVATFNKKVQLVSGTGHYIRTLHVENINGIGCIGIGMGDVLWISVLSETKKLFARTTKSDIKTIKYYKTRRTYDIGYNSAS